MSWREYHERTKHSIESSMRERHLLDWANMPNPFRHYEDVPVLDFPADPPAPEMPALAVLNGAQGSINAVEGASFLSQLFYYSASISASKRVPSTGYRYALRVNPSSGNLYPTEFHFVTQGLRNWPDGLYHYRPSSHMAEQRASGDLEMPWVENTVPIQLLLTSIVSREAWKYGNRAYRYCLHDIGHAWQAIAMAAQAMGCESFARGEFPDDKVSRLCRLHDDEWPMLLIELRGSCIPVSKGNGGESIWYGGRANQISEGTRIFPEIERIHLETKVSRLTSVGGAAIEPPRHSSGALKLPPSASSSRPFGEVTRMRRSALNFEGGSRSISLPQLSALLTVTTRPFSADFHFERLIRLYIYAHRVDGLEPGVYTFHSEARKLELIMSGDQRVAAAGLSLRQELAGNACAAFSMVGQMDRATEAAGDRGYRYVHFEAGATGHRLYLTAEALGLGATGIGAFYDDEVHKYLKLSPEQGRVVYHFAIGYPVADSRLSG
jgi:SagB-type dehydrogenase family enzyme